MNFTTATKAAILKRMVLATVAGAIAFMAVWVAGCALADFVLHLSANSWRMLFGFVVGTIALSADRSVVRWVKRAPHTQDIAP